MFEGLLQPVHLVLILALVLIIFGPGKLTGVGRSLGQSIRELRSAASGNSGEPVPAIVPATSARPVPVEIAVQGNSPTERDS